MTSSWMSRMNWMMGMSLFETDDSLCEGCVDGKDRCQESESEKDGIGGRLLSGISSKVAEVSFDV